MNNRKHKAALYKRELAHMEDNKLIAAWAERRMIVVREWMARNPLVLDEIGYPVK